MSGIINNRYIFLPANKKLLAELKFCNSIIGKLLLKYRKKKGNIFSFNYIYWKEALTYLNNQGYKIILYPSKNYSLPEKDLRKQLNPCLKTNLITDILSGNSLQDFTSAITKFKMSCVNSILITDDTETFRSLLKEYNANNDISQIIKGGPWGFTIKNWGKKEFSNSNLTEFNLTVEGDGLTSWLCKEAKPKHMLFAPKEIPFLNKSVIYIGKQGNEMLSNYITDNYDSIAKRIAEKGYAFIFFPNLKSNPALFAEKLTSAFTYLFPFVGHSKDVIEELITNLQEQSFYKFITTELDFSDLDMPALVKHIADKPPQKNLFSIYSFTGNDSPEIQVNYYLQNLKKYEVPFVAYSREDKKYNADDDFPFEANKLSAEIKAKINALLKQGQNKALAEMVYYILSNMQGLPLTLIKKINLLGEKDKTLNLSPLVIDKNYRIYLSDYSNVEIELKPLPKTLYLFILKHGKEIMWHDLVDYKTELLNIYSKLSNSSELYEVKKRIDDLVDVSNNSVNEKCSRIREAFTEKIGEELVNYYCITGGRGKPKKIALPNNLIRFKD